ncbi:mitochondrial glycine transporter [Lepeophtheirus salmonis]|uniref:Solute carrier family 25 member 38 n=1 Tax=Lepeophtheirus salmonis TaxID=72036 RepID=C1BS66_LEPSM|nr:mitochondrial glycine transporter-like [Lepeophtheirus salmonis]ACO11869.1 Solute carrier family 25 member 38 [Lepeophtheirus salmonis]
MKEGANSSKKGAVLRSFIAGSFSASVSTVLFQPLDLIKTRMIQRTVVFDGATMVTVTREVLSSDAKILGLWKGIAPSLLRTVPGVGIHFSSLTFLDKIGLKGKDTLSSLICGMMARSTAALITIPLTVVKVRYESGLFPYKSVISALIEMRSKEGYRGMSSGLIPTILRDAPFSGIYLAFYSTLKQKAQCSTLPDHDAAWIHFLCGLIAGMAASAVTHPADVIKTRIQLDHQCNSRNIMNVATSIWSQNGPKGYFVGLAPRMLRRSLMAALTWSVYEEIMKKTGLK